MHGPNQVLKVRVGCDIDTVRDRGKGTVGKDFSSRATRERKKKVQIKRARFIYRMCPPTLQKSNLYFVKKTMRHGVCGRALFFSKHSFDRVFRFLIILVAYYVGLIQSRQSVFCLSFSFVSACVSCATQASKAHTWHCCYSTHSSCVFSGNLIAQVTDSGVTTNDQPDQDG